MLKRGTAAPYFKSLNRPILILGVDRSLFFLLAGVCLPIAFSGHLAPLMDLMATVIFAIGYAFCLLITRADSQILVLYRRHIRYHVYYSAQPSIYSQEIIHRPSVPIFSGKRGIL